MSKGHIWLRAESKPKEERIALTPPVAKQLIDAGFQVSVEASSQSAIGFEEYAAVGCEIRPAHSWQNADKDTIILGLKELEQASWPLKHRHIHFAHVYKEQQGWQDVLQRFVLGKGRLYDLEYLVDAKQRRIAAFGYWAGFAGAAVALKAFIGHQKKENPVLAPLQSCKDKNQLIVSIERELEQLKKPTVLVIGAKGRSGKGAVEMAHRVGADVIEWDLEETQKGGPFNELLEVDIVINCVFVQSAIKPFLTEQMLHTPTRKLSVICDVSCDPYGDYNPLPIYQKCTTFDAPTIRLVDSDKPLDLIAIDHLPSLLPIESSEDFCQQLLPYLLQLDNLEQGVWHNANQVFEHKISQI